MEPSSTTVLRQRTGGMLPQAARCSVRAGTVARRLNRPGSDGGSKHPRAVHLHEVSLRGVGGQFFPRRGLDDHDMLRGVFVMLALSSRVVSANIVRQTRRAVEGE